jgi:glycerol-3-phosphate dehydrogenase (NAD(P)+)
MNSGERVRVGVLGAGSWGTALAALLARNGVPTTLWGRNPAEIAAFSASHENARYLPGIALPEALQFSADLAATVAASELVLVVTPSHAFTEMLGELRAYLGPGVGVAWATKGFEPGTGASCTKWPRTCWARDTHWPRSPARPSHARSRLGFRLR